MRKASRLARWAHSPWAWVRSRLSGPPSRRPVSTTARSASRKAAARASGSDAVGAIGRPSLLAAHQRAGRRSPRARPRRDRRARPRAGPGGGDLRPSGPGAGPRARRPAAARRPRARSARWASRGTLARSDAPGELVAADERGGARRSAPAPAAPPRRGCAAAWSSARGSSVARPAPARARGAAQAWASRPEPQPASSAGPAGRPPRGPPGTSRWWGGRRAEALAGGLDQLAHPGRGGQVGGAAPVPAGQHGRGRVGPARAPRARARAGRGQAASAGGRRARARSAARRPAPRRSRAHRLERRQRGQGGGDRRRRGADEEARGQGAAPLAWPLVARHRPRPARRAAGGRPAARSPPCPSTSAWRASRAHAPALAARGRAVVDAAVARGGPAAALRPARAGLGARPAGRPARAGRGDPPAPGARGLGDDAAGVGALRGGARLARGQLAGLGADPGRRLGPGRPATPSSARPSSRARAHHRPACSRPSPGAWPEGARGGGRPARARRPSRWSGTPGSHAVVAHASTRTCKRHLAGLGRAYAAGAPLRPYIPEGSGNDAMVVLAGRRPRRGRRGRRPRRLRQRRPAVHGGEADRSWSAAVWEAFRPRLAAAVAALRGGRPRRRRAPTSPRSPRARPAPGPAPRWPRRWRAGGEVLVGEGERRRATSPPTVVLLPRAALGRGALARGELRPPARPGRGRRRRRGPGAGQRHPLRASGRRSSAPARRRWWAACARRGCWWTRARSTRTPTWWSAGWATSGLAGARPKIEQLVWARRVHRAGGA